MLTAEQIGQKRRMSEHRSCSDELYILMKANETVPGPG